MVRGDELVNGAGGAMPVFFSFVDDAWVVSR
jgi:hypothetical protein